MKSLVRITKIYKLNIKIIMMNFKIIYKETATFQTKTKIFSKNYNL
jgi:hypothetical protein